MSMSSARSSSIVHPFRLAVDRGRTKEFRALVQDVERKRKRDDDGDYKAPPARDGEPPVSRPPAILPSPPPPPSRFTQSALHLRRAIMDLHTLLLSQQRAYLNVHRFLSSSSASSMTEAERDQLEATVAAAAVECAAKIEELKEQNKLGSHSDEDEEEEDEEEGDGWDGEDLQRHRGCIVLWLYDALHG